MAENTETPLENGNEPTVPPETPPATPPGEQSPPEKPPESNDTPPEGSKKPEVEAVIPMHRFNAVYGEKKALERKIAELEANKAPAEAPNEEPSEPKWEDYEAAGKSAEEFNADWVDYTVEKKLEAKSAEKKVKAKEASLQERQTKAGLNFQTQALAARAKYSDFDNVMASADKLGITFSPRINLALSEAKNAGDLAYHVIKNHENAYKLMNSDDDQALIELGRISAQLPSGNSQPDPKLTNADTPPNPLNGGGATETQFKDGVSLDKFSELFPVQR